MNTLLRSFGATEGLFFLKKNKKGLRGELAQAESDAPPVIDTEDHRSTAKGLKYLPGGSLSWLAHPACRGRTLSPEPQPVSRSLGFMNGMGGLTSGIAAAPAVLASRK